VHFMTKMNWPMPMPAAEIERLIKIALPDAVIELTALADDDDHWRRLSPLRFRGLEPRAPAPAGHAAFGPRLEPNFMRLALTTKSLRSGRKTWIVASRKTRNLEFRVKRTSDDRHQLPHKSEIESSDVVLFMKGTPQATQCGFSMQVVQILNHVGAPYKGDQCPGGRRDPRGY